MSIKEKKSNGEERFCVPILDNNMNYKNQYKSD